jgi:hypothetical protein
LIRRERADVCVERLVPDEVRDARTSAALRQRSVRFQDPTDARLTDAHRRVTCGQRACGRESPVEEEATRKWLGRAIWWAVT